jgi:hypothetical protein
LAILFVSAGTHDLAQSVARNNLHLLHDHLLSLPGSPNRVEMNPDMDSGDPTAHPDVSNSQPVLREVNKLLSRYNRTVSHRDEEIVRFNNLAIGELPSTPFETLTQLQMAVFKVLEERLKIRQVTSSALHQNSFTWSLPRS